MPASDSPKRPFAVSLQSDDSAWHERLLGRLKRIIPDRESPAQRVHMEPMLEAVVFHVTDKGRDEIQNKTLHLRRSMLDLLGSVDGTRGSVELLAAHASAGHTRESLLVLYNYDLIAPNDVAQGPVLDEAIEQSLVVLSNVPTRFARRELAYDIKERYFGFEASPAIPAAVASTPPARHERLGMHYMLRAASQIEDPERIALRKRIVEQRDAALASGKANAALTDQSESMILFLVGLVTLVETMSLYPRVVNKLADVWNSHTDFLAEINRTLLDDRGGRQGFPFAVVNELTELKSYYVENVAPDNIGREL
jgi:hypothetical protein